MKKLGIYLSLALSVLLSPMFMSCDDEKNYPPVVIPEDYGSGAWNEPMSVSQVINGSSGTGVWVTGYIVGWLDTNISNAYSVETAKFTVPCTVATNMLMAATPDETDLSKCIPVQLSSGTDARTALNLVDNPANLGKQVTVKGNAERYFGTNGFKSVSNYNFGPEGVYEKPLLPAIFEANKNGGFEKFIFVDSEVGTGSIWKVDSKYGIVASGYINGTRYDSDSWAVSPEINLSGYATVELTFRQAGNYFNSSKTFMEYCSVAVREVGGEWQSVTVPAMSDVTGSSWSYVSSGSVDLTAFAGKKIELGFNYKSSASKNLAGTWEIDEVRVSGEK